MKNTLFYCIVICFARPRRNVLCSLSLFVSLPLSVSSTSWLTTQVVVAQVEGGEVGELAQLLGDIAYPIVSTEYERI